MILNNASKNVVFQSGTNSESSFGIAMNGKAFRVLSDTIYQDKIGSLVREISCNAYDSHVQAGYPERPFAIHLPDTLEPFFSVTDYGLGLSDESVRKVFTMYFQSTKENSNDVIGAFGLGSKTPFAYTDSFTITSIYNGVRTVYSAYLNPEGIPSISVMDQSQTNDNNGVEVSVPVETKDFVEFRNAMARQLQFFNVKPTCNYVVEYKTSTIDNMLEAGNLILNRGYSGNLYVVQGVVGYELNTNNISEKLPKHLSEFLNNIVRIGGILNVSIGSVEVVASREGLSYNKTTIKALEVELQKAYDSVKKMAQDKFDSYPTAWEKAVMMNDVSAIARIVKLDVSQLGTRFDQNSYSNIVNVDLTGFSAKRFDSNRIKLDKDITRSIPAGNNVVFVIKDTTRQAMMRLENYYSEYNTKHGSSPLILVLQTADDVNNVSDKLGNAPVLTISGMPEIPKGTSTRARSNYKPPSAYIMKQATYCDSTHHWEKLQDTSTITGDNIVVFPVFRGKIQFEDYHVASYLLQNDYTVVGLRVADIAEFIENVPDAVKIEDIYDDVLKQIEKRVKRYVKLKGMNQAISNAIHIGTVYIYNNTMSRIANKFNIETELAGTNMALIKTSRDRIEKFGKKISKMLECVSISYYENQRIHGSGYANKILNTKLEKLTELVDKSFGNLPLMADRYGNASNVAAAHLVEYIKAFDKV